MKRKAEKNLINYDELDKKLNVYKAKSAETDSSSSKRKAEVHSNNLLQWIYELVGSLIVKVPKTDKLLEFKVDLGNETRTIVSFAEFYQPEDLSGKM